MSSDRLVLTALEHRTKARLRFAELVEVHIGTGHGQAQTHRCYVGVGDHSLFLVSHNLSGLLRPCGEIKYDSIDSATQDAKSVGFLVLVLNDRRPDAFVTHKLLIVSEHRHRLVGHFRCAWQTSFQWRRRRVGELLLRTGLLTPGELGEASRGPAQLAVQAFHGYKVANHDGYSFFLKKDFEEKHRSGAYLDNLKMTMRVQIQDPRPTSELAHGCNDQQHIRWVAARQRQAISEDLSSPLMMRNNFYQKKMNLANDIASWTGWEVLLRSDEEVRVMISLRRQYMPPMTDCSQDIFVTLICPKHVLDANQSLTDDFLLNEARITADSVAPLVQRCSVPQTMYRDMIQAKLDALLFDTDSMEWIRNSLGLLPDPSLQRAAKSFVKSLLKILEEETVLRTPDLLRDVGDDVTTEKEPISVPYQMQPVGYRPHSTAGTPDGNNPVMNAWLFRVAKYLAWCLDGGLCGPRLGLQDIICVFISTAQSQKKLDEVVMFLLHVRPKDFSQPYEKMLLKYFVFDPDLLETHVFNDHVMQSLVELGWFEEALCRSNGVKLQDRQEDSLVEYASLLSSLLRCSTASINLKAAVCRQIIARGEGMQKQLTVLCQSLMDLAHQSNIFLRTYATLALVSLAAKSQEVHNKVMELHGIDVCMSNLKSGDDDLIRYTLVLLTHLTKSSGRVKALQQSGVPDLVMTLLEKTPSAPSKQMLLAELASVIGQLCNDLEVWKGMCSHPCRPVEKLATLFTSAPPGGRLRSKAMFALKMFVDYPETDKALRDRRDAVAKLAEAIIADLSAGLKKDELDPDEPDRLDLDFAANAILLLGCLSKSTQRKTIAAVRDVERVLARLTLAKIGQVDSVREKLAKLLKRIAETNHGRLAPPG